MTRRRGKGQPARRKQDVVGQPQPTGATGEPKTVQGTEPAVVEQVTVQVRVAASAHIVGPGQFLRIQPKPTKEPTLMVFIAETGFYQPVFIQPGASWILMDEGRLRAMEAKIAEQEKPRIINPFG